VAQPSTVQPRLVRCLLAARFRARGGGAAAFPVSIARTLGLALLLPLLLAACVPRAQRPSGRLLELPRYQPHDGLAVVTQPGGRGLHLWLDTDTSQPGLCRPRWHPDAARLRDGDGPRPRSSGRAPRAEWLAALQRGPLRLALRRSSEALCRLRAPQARFQWLEPPRSAAELAPLELVPPPVLRLPPRARLRAEKRFLGLPLSPDDWRPEDPPPPVGP